MKKFMKALALTVVIAFSLPSLVLADEGGKKGEVIENTNAEESTNTEVKDDFAAVSEVQQKEVAEKTQTSESADVSAEDTDTGVSDDSDAADVVVSDKADGKDDAEAPDNTDGEGNGAKVPNSTDGEESDAEVPDSTDDEETQKFRTGKIRIQKFLRKTVLRF